MHTYHKLRRRENAKHLPAQITGEAVMQQKLSACLVANALRFFLNKQKWMS